MIQTCTHKVTTNEQHEVKILLSDLISCLASAGIQIPNNAVVNPINVLLSQDYDAEPCGCVIGSDPDETELISIQWAVHSEHEHESPA